MGEHHPHRESLCSPPEQPLPKLILLQCPLPCALHLAPAAECFPAVHRENGLGSRLSKSNLLLQPPPGHATPLPPTAQLWPSPDPSGNQGSSLTWQRRNTQSPRFNLLFHWVRFLLDQRTEPASQASTRAEAKEGAEGYSRSRDMLLRSMSLANFRIFVCLF